jgi:hypothetical protein
MRDRDDNIRLRRAYLGEDKLDLLDLLVFELDRGRRDLLLLLLGVLVIGNRGEGDTAGLLVALEPAISRGDAGDACRVRNLGFGRGQPRLRSSR